MNEPVASPATNPRASDHPAVRQFARHVNPAFVKLLGMAATLLNLWNALRALGLSLKKLRRQS